VLTNEKSGYIDILMELCLSNTSNICHALHNSLIYWQRQWQRIFMVSTLC